MLAFLCYGDFVKNSNVWVLIFLKIKSAHRDVDKLFVFVMGGVENRNLMERMENV